ncbi:MAG: hypothetical protein AB7O28_13915 [Vicinamibacterales bacterium]
MSTRRTAAWLTGGALAIAGAAAVPRTWQAAATPSVSAWLNGAAEAMGGEASLRSLTAVETSGITVWYHREQSERPEGPWLLTVTDFTDVRHFGADTVLRTSRARGFSTNDWVDSRDWTAAASLLVTSGLAVGGAGSAGTATGTPPDLEALPVGLAPERLVLAARDAADGRAEADEWLDGSPHHVVGFTVDGARVRLFLQAATLLPKAVEITRPHPYDLALAPWGDVTQRVTFGMWTLEPSGLRYPRLWSYTTGGAPDGSTSVTRVRVNPPAPDAAPTSSAAGRLAHRPRIADLPFGLAGQTPRIVGPGIVVVPGRFGVVEVRQDDGVVIVDAPLSSEYSARAIADARARFGSAPVKAVITTSDAWPHIGGIREYVARGIPIFALDVNIPILTRLIAAPYRSWPDALAARPREPDFRPVMGPTTLGTGETRLEMHPFRTATGERQMMIYWPTQRLLYSSDLFTLRDDFVFLPQQVSEAVAAVAREHLDVVSAFGMHYGVTPWAAVVAAAAPPGSPR